MAKLEESDEEALMMTFVQTRDRRAFEQLYERYKKPMLAHAARYVRDREPAEALAQEIFVRLYATRTYESHSRFRTWLYRMATSVCLTEAARLDPHQLPEEFDTFDENAKTMKAKAPPRFVVEPGAPQPTLTEQLERALHVLPANQRAAFLLLRQEGMSLEEIAEILSTSVPAVKVLVHRALEALRREVRLLGVEVPPHVPKEATR